MHTDQNKCDHDSLLEAVLLIYAVPDPPGFWSFIAGETLRVQQEINILWFRWVLIWEKKKINKKNQWCCLWRMTKTYWSCSPMCTNYQAAQIKSRLFDQTNKLPSNMQKRSDSSSCFFHSWSAWSVSSLHRETLSENSRKKRSKSNLGYSWVIEGATLLTQTLENRWRLQVSLPSHISLYPH